MADAVGPAVVEGLVDGFGAVGLTGMDGGGHVPVDDREERVPVLLGSRCHGAAREGLSGFPVVPGSLEGRNGGIRGKRFTWSRMGDGLRHGLGGED